MSCQKIQINQNLSVSRGYINFFWIIDGKMCKLVDSTSSLHFTSFHLDFYILSLFIILSTKLFHAFRTVLLTISAHLKKLKFCCLFWSDTQVFLHFYWNGSSDFQLWSGFPNLFSVFLWSNLSPWKIDLNQCNWNQFKSIKMLQKLSAIILWGIFASHMP